VFRHACASSRATSSPVHAGWNIGSRTGALDARIKIGKLLRRPPLFEGREPEHLHCKDGISGHHLKVEGSSSRADTAT
jgi:hypothetical protein